MDIQGYLEQRCALHTIRRGDLPALLGYRNSAKALRRYDRFIKNGAVNKRFADRLRACPLFAGDEFEQALAVTQRLLYIDRKTQHIVEDLKLRRAFVPHVWFVYESPLPNPVTLLKLGEERLRTLSLPESLRTSERPATGLQSVIGLLRQFIIARPDHHVLHGAYGKAVAAIYRDSFDHGFIIDINTFEVIGERRKPIIPTTIVHRNREKLCINMRELEIWNGKYFSNGDDLV